jgi:hypothetical protein
MKTRIVAAVAALALGTTVMASQAQAHHFHGGGWAPFGAGIVAGAIIGATVADGPYYSCHWVRQYDQWGHYVGSTKVCS